MAALTKRCSATHWPSRASPKHGSATILPRGLFTDQMVVPATFGAKLPQQMALPYAGLMLEGREGQIAFVPSAAFAPKTAPTEAQLQTFFTRNAARYRMPERRILRYATFITDRFRDQVKVSDAEIAALLQAALVRVFRDRKARYRTADRARQKLPPRPSPPRSTAAQAWPLPHAKQDWSRSIWGCSPRKT